ncbi:MAG: nitronate monooxygenase [Fimbriimonadaceae bacterium]|nr:nitronate monooxygenase [Fimbriimonadaceae bacterium]
MTYPKIIQGGMGVAVSNWRLAHAVSSLGQMGVVSGTGIDAVLVRRLQLGDVGGHMRAAMDHFPVREMAERIWERYFVPGGKAPDKPFKSKPVPALNPPRALVELLIVSNFVEVFLAKRGHSGPVGVNLLEKIQLPTLPSLFGAMLAGVDFVLMGAGIPRAIPLCMDQLAALEPSEISIYVAGALAGENYVNRFVPREYFDGPMPPRPRFLAIVSSNVLAITLARKTAVPPDGFVIEGPTAGGHNAPPRGALTLNEIGEPIYGPRDVPDLAGFRDLGLPFWLAGGFGHRMKLSEALAEGAQGVQVGTPFAFCEESGIDPNLKTEVIRRSLEGTASVYTDPLASPTGFPFKVLQMAGTLSEKAVYEERSRICDLGYLRTAYRKEDGTVGYRCASEPVEDYVAKGGDVAETAGRKCVCNGLMATAGFPQFRKSGETEQPILTSGDDVANLRRFVRKGETNYTAADVLDVLLGEDAPATGEAAELAGV